MTRLSLILFFIGYGYNCHGQLYKADLVCVKEDESFRSIANKAFLDYNTKKKYVQLAFQDTLYCYRILQTNKPKDKQRFVVWFKKTDDNMLWNTTEEGNYVFGFKMGEQTYWYRELSNPSRSEFNEFVEGKPLNVCK